MLEIVSMESKWKWKSNKSTPTPYAVTPSLCGKPTVTSHSQRCCFLCWFWASPSSSTSKPSVTFGSPSPSCRCSQRRRYRILRLWLPLWFATPLLWQFRLQPISTTQRGKNSLCDSCGRRRCGCGTLSWQKPSENRWRVWSSKESPTTQRIFTMRWKWKQQIQHYTSKLIKFNLSLMITWFNIKKSMVLATIERLI